MSVTENGVEVSLYPDTVLSAIPHTDRMAIDFGGSQYNNWVAPCKLKVVKRLNDAYNSVIMWSVDKVLTPKGLFYITLWLMHDNDIADLTVGRIFEQGQPFYQEGGMGKNGPRSYPTHIHCATSLNHTTWIKTNANGKPELNGGCWANDVFFLKGTEKVINDGGLKWVKYVKPTFLPGDRVKIIGTNYATGQYIKSWVKLRTHTIQKVSGEKALLKEIQSWVYFKDIKKS